TTAKASTARRRTATAPSNARCRPGARRSSVRCASGNYSDPNSYASTRGASNAANCGFRAQLTNSLDQTLQVIGLAKYREALANGFLRLLAVSGGEKDRNIGMIAPHEPGELKAGHAAGHEKIGKDQIV